MRGPLAPLFLQGMPIRKLRSAKTPFAFELLEPASVLSDTELFTVLIGADKLPKHWMTSVARALPHTTSACLPKTLTNNVHQRQQLPATATWPLHQARLQCSNILTLRVPNASTSNTTCCARTPCVWKCLVVWTARQRCSTPMRHTGPVNGPRSDVHLQHSLHFLPPQPGTP